MLYYMTYHMLCCCPAPLSQAGELAMTADLYLDVEMRQTMKDKIACND